MGVDDERGTNVLPPPPGVREPYPVLLPVEEVLSAPPTTADEESAPSLSA